MVNKLEIIINNIREYILFKINRNNNLIMSNKIPHH